MNLIINTQHITRVKAYDLKIFLFHFQVEALILINVVSTPAGWIEWGYQKLNARYLKSKGMTQGVLDYLMWHHFGRVSIQFLYKMGIFLIIVVSLPVYYCAAKRLKVYHKLCICLFVITGNRNPKL